MNPVFALEQRFLRALCDECAIPKGGRLLVAVSGGSDSVALLRLLQRTAGPSRHSLVVAHLDHGLRLESAADAEFVRTLADQLNLPLVAERLDVPALARAAGVGWEEAARNARRDFLHRTAAEEGCDWIVLGHHRGDQAETVLHRMLRGTGATGLAGMRPRQGKIVRPLLSLARDELLAYLRSLGQAYVEDASNQDLRYTRNRIRHELLPRLNHYTPRIEDHLAGMARRLALEEDYWREQVEALWQGLTKRFVGDCLVLLRDELLKFHPAMQVRLLRFALATAGVSGELGQVHLAAIGALLAGCRPQGNLDLPGGWVGRRYAELWIGAAPPDAVMAWSREITGPGVYPLPDGSLLQVTIAPVSRGEHRGRVEFSAEEVDFPLTVRRPCPGDRFRPSGMVGSKKLKDYFIDERRVHEERRQQLLVLSGREILWLVGRRRCSGLVADVGGAVLGLEVIQDGN